MTLQHLNFSKMARFMSYKYNLNHLSKEFINYIIYIFILLNVIAFIILKQEKIHSCS